MRSNTKFECSPLREERDQSETARTRSLRSRAGRHLRPVWIAALLAGAFTGFAQDAATPPAEDHSAEFKVLDIDLERFDELIARYDEPITRVNMFAYRNLFKSRAEEVKKSFDQAKYDELRYDINLQCQRMASYLAPLKTLPRPPGETRSEFSVAKLNPSPGNPADIKAALDALDGEIKRLEVRAGGLVMGSMARESEMARIQRIKDHRQALASDFTKARWKAMVAELAVR